MDRGGVAAPTDVNPYRMGTLEQAMHYRLIGRASLLFPVRKGGVCISKH